MLEICSAVRQTKFDGFAWQVGQLGNTWKPILDRDTNRPAILQPQWSVTSCLDLWSRCYLLFLERESGQRAVWILDHNLRFISDLVDFNADCGRSVYETVVVCATSLMRTIRRELVFAQNSIPSHVLRASAPQILAAFAKFANDRPKSWILNELAEEIPLQATPKELLVKKSRLLRILNVPGSWLDLAAEAGRVAIPALAQEGNVDAAFLIVRSGSQPTYLCIEKESNLYYYLVCTEAAAPVLFFPRDNLLISEHQIGDVEAGTLISYLDLSIAQAAFNLVSIGATRFPDEVSGLGLFSSGILNFGHAIWDEMQALEVLVTENSKATGNLSLSFVASQSGLDLYGAIEDLYPELGGRVLRAASEAHVIASAIHEGRELVVRDGRRARYATRRRIASFIEHFGNELDLATAYESVCIEAARPLPVIVFGVRLTNRCPSDLLGLYLRFAAKLREEFGPYVIILDGINGGADPTKAAALIYNASRQAENGLVNVLRDGTLELHEELQWASAFESGLANQDVRLVNCIGMPIRQNLFWLKKADFFVAPLGGGLAKLRWALDVPGFVLSSRANLDYCSLLHAYDDQSQMDLPFSPLYFNRREEVVDIPLMPARSQPISLDGIPHPENFVVNEELLFGRLVELVKRYVDVGRSSFEPLAMT